MYRYTYDYLGQLTREDNRPLGKSYEYEYDNAGNILSKKTYAFTIGLLGTTSESTVTYSYDNATWGDLLTEFSNSEGISWDIEYDNIGNPTSITSLDGYNYYMEW